jgi:signal transduction histidine kinase
VSYRDVTRDAEINRLKSEFVSNVSHELRTPMAAIKGFLGVVLEDEASLDAETRRKFLGIARHETDRLSRLIDDLLDISRIESGRARRHVSSFPLAELLRDAVLMARPEAEAARLELVLDVPPVRWRLVADRDQVSQVLHNLLGNAVKFTPPEGKVHLWAEAAGGELRLRVADTGRGIVADDLPRIFDKFYRCRAAGVGPVGTGLGLAIAKELVEAHGGHIDVESRLGEGSVFTVCLPWTGDENSSGDESSSGDENASGDEPESDEGEAT